MQASPLPPSPLPSSLLNDYLQLHDSLYVHMHTHICGCGHKMELYNAQSMHIRRRHAHRQLSFYLLLA